MTLYRFGKRRIDRYKGYLILELKAISFRFALQSPTVDFVFEIQLFQTVFRFPVQFEIAGFICRLMISQLKTLFKLEQFGS